MRSMVDDYYQFDEDNMTLTGENTGRSFKLGQTVKVRLSDVNVPKRQITFATVDEEPAAKPAEAASPAKEAPAATKDEELPVLEAEFTETVIPEEREKAPEKELEKA